MTIDEVKAVSETIAGSVADLDEKEIEALQLLNSAPHSSIDLCYELKVLPSEMDGSLSRLKKEGLITRGGPANYEWGEVVALSERGRVAASVIQLAATDLA